MREVPMSNPDIADVPAGDGPAVPVHVGIIMDGNGRWAAARGLPRIEGHRRGVEALRRTVRNAGDLGIKFVTIYSFSTENWSRPQQEISDLMGLIKRFVREDLAELHRAGVRVMMIGERSGLDPEILKLVGDAEVLTRDNGKLTLCVAFNYGGRQEIARAARRIAEAAVRGEIDLSAVDERMLEANLDTAGVPDPDLIIRTSGELRLSNFLLWQAAYAEFVVLPTHWPDFDRAAFEQALQEFGRRQRRFGGLEVRARA
jgi:undecaprenyl diphosphate synthase